MDLTVFLLVIAIFCITLYFVRTPSNLPPGHFKFPIFGSIFLLHKLSKRRHHLVFADEARKYGGVFRWYLGNQMFVVLSEINVINEALVKKAEIFSDRLRAKGGITGASKGIVWSNYGQHWRVLRKFTQRALHDFGVGRRSLEEKINFEIQVVTGVLEAANGQPVSISNLMRNVAANVNYEIIFGKRFDYDDPELDRITELSDVLNSASLFSAAFFLPEFLAKFVKKSDFEIEVMRKEVMNDVAKYVGEQIEEHRNTFDPTNLRDFLDLYLDADRNKTDEGDAIINRDSMFRVIVDLFVAGTETTQTALSWAFIYLVEFPDVQEKCQKEINTKVNGKAIQYRDRNCLVYVNAFIMEVHRYCCMVPLNLPHYTSADTTLSGYHIPKGTVILPMQYSVSMDPNLFKNPEKFDPGRFIDEEGQLINKLSFVPYSTGPRVCLGEALARTEMFLVLTTLLQNFNFLREDPNVPQSFEADVTSNTLNRPLPVKIRAIKKKRIE
ncbi:cytochrome P450 2U1-like [Ruditapes philippinarum]|uniref:cytochrome P450 2U1-like n=1 Tax=Ruditapes philippinarum TaxID=129788 RepID=UPI00295B691E|nr:cytochrome P450 2U1-like [Ruditapes philippinarum]